MWFQQDKICEKITRHLFYCGRVQWLIEVATNITPVLPIWIAFSWVSCPRVMRHLFWLI